MNDKLMAFERLQNWLAQRAGFYRELPDYFRGLKKTAIQEILYGESVLMTAFAVYTYVYSISLSSVLLVLAGSFVLAGYHIWRADHLRLIPKLGLDYPCYRKHKMHVHGPEREYVQVVPRLLTDSPVEGCVAHLLRIARWDSLRDDWVPTELDHAIALQWSNGDGHPRTLYPGVEHRINVLSRDDQGNLAVESQPQNIPAKYVFAEGEFFRFDILISAEESAPIDLSLKIGNGLVIERGESWYEGFTVEKL